MIVFVQFSASMTTLICETIQKAENLLRHSSDMPTLTRIVVMDYSPNQETSEKFSSGGLKIFSFDEVMEMGRKHPHSVVVLIIFYICLQCGIILRSYKSYKAESMNPWEGLPSSLACNLGIFLKRIEIRKRWLGKH